MDKETNSTGTSSTIDPARKYATQDSVIKNNWTCSFCKKVLKGGAYRLKQHLVGGHRNATKCPTCPEDVRAEVDAFMKMKEKARIESQVQPGLQNIIDDHDEEEDVDLTIIKGGTTTSGLKSIYDNNGNNSGDDDDLVFDGDDLTWDAVGRASGAHEPDHATRASTSDKGKNVASSSTPKASHTRRVVSLDEEEDMEEDIGEENNQLEEDEYYDEEEEDIEIDDDDF